MNAAPSIMSRRHPMDLSAHRSRIAALGAFLFTFFASALILSGAASAQVIVVQSTAKGLEAGSMLEPKARVSIPAGASAVVVLPSGAMRTIAGPYDGTAAGLAKGSKSNPDVFDAVKKYVVTGGSNQRNVGAVRSAAPISFRKPLPFSWAAVPVHGSGDFCIKKGAKLNLVRTSTASAEAITIVDMQSKRRVQINFAKGEANVPWPDDLDVDPRSTYAVISPGPVKRELRMRIIEPLPAREDMLQVLRGQRCDSQFRAFIRELQSASK